MPLRPYQASALARFEASSARAVLIVAPTGAGKGTMAVELMVRAHHARRRALFLVHRTEIALDILVRLRRRGVLAAQTLRSDRFVRIMTTQQALRAETLPVDLLLVDEAHHYAADEWQTVLRAVEARRIVGFTATPERADGRPLGDTFTELIETVSYSALTRLGLLVPARVLRPVDALRGALATDPAAAYLRHGRRERALFYLPRVADAERVCDTLRAHQVAAAVLLGSTPRVERDAVLGRFARGELRALVSVGVLTEGVDVPEASVCVLARPCAHASTYVQIVGRVLRPSPGKVEATVIDLVGASHAHGLPGDDMIYSLAGRAIQPKGAAPREYVEPSPTDVLDLELVTVRRGKAPTEGKRIGGFVYHDKAGFYSMRWTDARGERRRLGLCTKDRATADATLATLRGAGEQAARDEVHERKRRRATLMKNHESSVWHLSTWNDARTKVVKISLHTRDRTEAEQLRALYGEDRDAFHARLQPLRDTHEAHANARRGDARRKAD